MCIQVHIDGRSQKTFEPSVMADLLNQQATLNLKSWIGNLKSALNTTKISYGGFEVSLQDVFNNPGYKPSGVNGVICAYSDLLRVYEKHKVRMAASFAKCVCTEALDQSLFFSSCLDKAVQLSSLMRQMS